MAIHFPDKPEIKLGKAPLTEVICQLKFPMLLRLSQDAPVDFQEVVRTRFPLLKVEQGVLVQFRGAAGSEKPLTESLPKIYYFASADEQRELTLAPDFLALSFHTYTHWYEILENLKLGTQALIQLYQPPYSTRVGLRFVNQLTLNNTGCETLDELSNLLRPELTAMLKTDSWGEPAETLSQVLLQDGDGKLVLRYGLRKESAGTHFLLDFDYFEEGQLSLDNLQDRLERFHTRIYAAFRWCILDQTLERFAPLAE